MGSDEKSLIGNAKVMHTSKTKQTKANQEIHAVFPMSRQVFNHL